MQDREHKKTIKKHLTNLIEYDKLYLVGKTSYKSNKKSYKLKTKYVDKKK